MDLNMFFHPNDIDNKVGKNFAILEKGLQMMAEEKNFNRKIPSYMRRSP